MIIDNKMKNMKIAFAGPMQQENLAMGYLASALEANGHDTHLVRFNSGADHQSCLNELLEFEPDLIGFGIPFQYAIGDYVRLANSIRSAGFKGHITCGGHVPTFCYRELLRDCKALDTVVRHEGEETLVELVGLLSRNKPVCNLPGLVWRTGDGLGIGEPRKPANDMDSLPFPKRRKTPLRIGGVPIAFIISSRGCVGNCAYCSIRAFAKDMGGPAFRMRSSVEVAREVAELYHNLDARVFFVQDDLFILKNERKTVQRMNELEKELEARNVDGALFWIKGRPESITDNVLEAAVAMGAIHVFLGIESASDERLRYLGRTHKAKDNRRALELCRKHGIRPSFNFMLFDPDCTLADVSATIDLAEENLDMPWNICRTEIYSGTRLLDRLHKEGRLEGDYRTYGYTMRDTRAEILFRMMRICLHERAFAFDSLLNNLIALSFSRQIHESLFPGPSTDALNREVDALIVDAHRDTVHEMRSLLEEAGTVDPHDREEVRRFAVEKAFEINARDVFRYERFDQIWDRMSFTGRLAFRQKLASCGLKNESVENGVCHVQ